ncbi:alkaline phosphatase family protein [Colwelliaceae bacterium 6471]
MTDKHLAVINVVGLSSSLISETNTPFIHSLLNKLKLKSLEPVFPSVTTTAQSAILTGKMANDHGIVGNGWYFDDLAEVAFWKQNSRLVQSPKIWEVLKQQYPNFSCANSFWWYNMYSSVDYSMTPRPHYPADGRKILDLYSYPAQFHYQIEESIGKFPFFNFWGPKADINSSRWIANAAVEVQRLHMPNLHLIYLPHLDYNLQRLGPEDPKIKDDLVEIDAVLKDLCCSLEQLNTDYILVSEYGIEAVNQPVHINKFLRENGYISVRSSDSTELLDCGASKAFAVADHQIAHIYVKDKQDIAQLRTSLQELDGVEFVLDEEGKAQYGIAHKRAGDLILIARKGAWFTYYYWLDDAKAPDFARTIDIHRKPGYDPVEMFLDPDNKLLKAKIIWRLIQKKLGFRMLLDVIPLKPELVKGSHGRITQDKNHWPVVIASKECLENKEKLTDLFEVIADYF